MPKPVRQQIEDRIAKLTERLTILQTREKKLIAERAGLRAAGRSFDKFCPSKKPK